MARDCNDCELKAGDIVTIEARVQKAYEKDHVFLQMEGGPNISISSQYCSLKPAESKADTGPPPNDPTTLGDDAGDDGELAPHKLDGTGKVLSDALD